MKYVKKIPKTDLELRDALLLKGWQPIKEASNLIIAILLSIPFMVINALITYFVLSIIHLDAAASVITIINASSWEFTIRFDYPVYLFLFIILHEFLHLVCIPNFYKSQKTFWGLRPWGGFVFTTEELSKSRFLIVTIVPFITLSIIMPVILGLFGLLNSFMLFLVFLNAISSSVDMLNFFTVLFQVPRDGRIINNGFESYYVNGSK